MVGGLGRWLVRVDRAAPGPDTRQGCPGSHPRPGQRRAARLGGPGPQAAQAYYAASPRREPRSWPAPVEDRQEGGQAGRHFGAGGRGDWRKLV